MLVGEVQFLFHRIVFADHLRAEHQEARGDQPRGPVRFPPAREDVAGELLPDEPVVGLVFVERLNDVVAIAPGVPVDDVVVHAVAVGVAGHIQPVAPPAFAVARRSEQAVHEARERVFRVVVQERAHLVGIRRQAMQVERGAPDQRSLVRPASGPEAL